MADLYLPVQSDVTKLTGSTVSREWQLFLQKLIQLLGTAGSSQLITSPPVTVLNADIKAMPTTPMQILASPGAGLVNVPTQIILTSNFAAPYTNINATSAYLSAIYQATSNLWSGYLADDSTASVPLTHFSAFFGVTTRRRVQLGPFFDTSDAALEWGTLGVPVDLNNDSALMLTIVNGGSGDLTGGDPTNTLSVVTQYLTLQV